jgi:hypothetical protein
LAAAFLDDGAALLFGSREQEVGTGDAAAVVALRFDGDFAKQQLLSLGTLRAAGPVGAFASGTAYQVAGGALYAAVHATEERRRIWRVNQFGAVHWQRDVETGIRGPFFYADDRRLLVGGLKTHDHLSPWGHQTCEEAGVCGTMKWSDCDDGNPCTKNLCEPDTGCANPPFEDGTPCGYEDGAVRTCAGGVCQL